VPVEQRVVAAAQLARSSLELAVADVLLKKGHNLSRAWMASRLTVFGWLVGDELGATARLSWTGLSRACHRHAFELPPGEEEVRALIARVRWLIEGTQNG
jgi:hypothetical protein